MTGRAINSRIGAIADTPNPQFWLAPCSLAGNDIGPTGGVALASALPRCTALTSIQYECASADPPTTHDS